MVTPSRKARPLDLPNLPSAPATPDGQQSQAVFAAILEAAKGDCECTPCKLLRRVSSDLTARVLGQAEQ